jgi:hypothetical protein
MNYRPMFEFASGERLGNAQVFATREEAQGSAEDRFPRLDHADRLRRGRDRRPGDLPLGQRRGRRSPASGSGGRVMDWFEDWLQSAIEKLAAWLENKK